MTFAGGDLRAAARFFAVKYRIRGDICGDKVATF